MKLHREGYLIIAIAFLLLSGVHVGNYFLHQSLGWTWLYALLTVTELVMMYLVVQFFRVPNITPIFGENEILCPADGKVVVIEETEESNLPEINLEHNWQCSFCRVIVQKSEKPERTVCRVAEEEQNCKGCKHSWKKL